MYMSRNLRKLLSGALVFSVVSLFAAQAAAAQPGFAQVSGSPYAAGTSPQSIAFSPNGALVATANAGANDVSVFTVSSSGTLTAVSGSPFKAGSGPQSVAFSPSGGLLAVANKSDNTVSVFTVSAGGSLTQVSGSPFKTGAAPDSVAFSATGGLLAVANGAGNTVSMFSVSSTGSLTQVGSAAAVGTNPDSVAFSPSGGTYAHLPPNSSLLAVANGGSNTVSMFSVSSTASLTAISAYATGTTPASVAFSPNGSGLEAGFIGNLATANSGSNNVTIFRISSTGTLGPAAAFATGHGPRSVQYSPGGELLATADATDNAVSLFMTLPVSGNLVPLSLTGFPLRLGSAASGPASVAFSPNGKLLATANSASNNISVFDIVDCSATFNQAFQAGFHAGFNPGFNTVFRAAYKPHGAWQVGFARGFEAAHGKRGLTGDYTVGKGARIASTRSAAPDPSPRAQTAAQQACDPVFNPAFNSGFNAAYNAAFNAAYNSAFNNGFQKGYATGQRHS
jgi:DNA-binding beta-propeller fold protein YncE